MVGLSQSERSKLYITLNILSLVRRFPCSLPRDWYILHVLWLRLPDGLLSYWYILYCLVIWLGSDLATRHLLLVTTIIVVKYLQMTHAVLVIQDTNQLSLSLV